MTELRKESLNLYNSGRSQNNCYEDGQISVRLIKESQRKFILTIHNKSNEPLNIEYYDMRGHEYSKEIKIASWANQRYIKKYTLVENGFMDIKFTLSITDLNFKFLFFYFLINRKLSYFPLPITLLDMCHIHSPIHQHSISKYSLKGTTISCKPFSLAHPSLPSFLGSSMLVG